jgi:hypothetical protein
MKMDFSSVNWLAVIACVVVSMVSGAIWYNPKVFFNIWWKGIGKSEDDAPQSENMGMTWALTVLAAFVQAVGMSFMVTAVGSQMTMGITAGSGALTGFMLWLGFIAPTYLVNKLFAGHGFKVWGIEVGNHLLNFVLFGVILGVWR